MISVGKGPVAGSEGRCGHCQVPPGSLSFSHSCLEKLRSGGRQARPKNYPDVKHLISQAGTSGCSPLCGLEAIPARLWVIFSVPLLSSFVRPQFSLLEALRPASERQGSHSGASASRVGEWPGSVCHCTSWEPGSRASLSEM